MQSLDAQSQSSRIHGAAPAVAADRRWTPSAAFDARREDQMAAIRSALESHGGLWSADQCLRRLRDNGTAQPLSRLGRWIARREVLALWWQGEIWLPAIQFADDLSLRRSVQAILLELAPAFDEWELAMWLVTPNDWIGHRLPLEMLGIDPASVAEAARVDRFIALG